MLRKILVSTIIALACFGNAHSGPIPPGPSGSFIYNSAAVQTGAKFNVSSGTVQGKLTAGELAVTTLTIAGPIAGTFTGSGAGLTGIPWAGVLKTGSNLSDLVTRDHSVLSSSGSNTHAQIDSHISSSAVHGATSVNTASKIVARDASGNFAAGAITATEFLGPVTGNALTASTAASVAGGLAGNLLYQSAANTTAMLPAGTVNYVLQAKGAAAPTWTSSPTITGANITGIPLAALNSGTLPASIPASSITVTGVTPGTYGGPIQSAQITIGSDGRITSATQLPIPAVSTNAVLNTQSYSWTKYQNFQSSVTVGSIYENGVELLTAINSTGTAVTVLQADLATEVSNRQIAVAAVAVSTGINAADIAALKISTGALKVQADAIAVSTGATATSLASVILSTGALDLAKVNRAGDSMTGQLTLSNSTMTITGNSGKYGLTVSSGVSLSGTLYIVNNRVGIGTESPNSAFQVIRSATDNGILSQSGGVNGTYYPLTATNFGGTKGIWLRDNGNLGVNQNAPTAQLDIVSDKAPTGYNVKISSQDATNIFNIMGNGQINSIDGAVFGGTITIQGSGFSVGGSTFVVSNGGISLGGATGGTTGDITLALNDKIQWGDAGATATLDGRTWNWNLNDSDINIAQNNGGDINFNLASGNEVFFKNNGNVGIGVGTSPSSKLHVGGDITTTSSITVQGSAFSVGGSTLVVHEGKVGIGATPTVSFQIGALQSHSLPALTSAFFPGNQTVRIGSNDNDPDYGSYFSPFYTSAAGLTLGTRAGTDIPTLTMLSGNIGIGISTPTTKLHVVGSAAITGPTTFSSSVTINAYPGGLEVDADGTGAYRTIYDANSLHFSSPGSDYHIQSDYQSYPAISIHNDNDAPQINIWKGSVYASTFTYSGGASLFGNLSVQGNTFSVGGSTLVVSNGMVAINRSAPTAALDVVGTMYIGNSTANQGQIYTDGTNLNINYPGFAHDVMIDAPNVRLNGLSGGKVGVGVAAPVGLFQVGGGSLTVTTAGQVGIGTTNPIEVNGADKLLIQGGALTVNGPANYNTVTSRYSSDGSAVTLGAQAGAGTIQATPNLAFYVSADYRMKFSATGGLSIGNSYYSIDPGLNKTIFEGGVGIGTSAPVGFFTVATPANTNSQTAYALLISSGPNIAFGVHPNGHLSIHGSSTTIGTCANGALSANARDTAGRILFTGANSSCSITFGSPFDATPACVLTGAVATATEGAILSAESANGFTVVPNTGAWDNGDAINYICMGVH